MKIFYGWIIVAVGIVVTCVGFGAMATLTVFLQPMAEAMGWSRTGVSTAALINWLCMGAGGFLWGALSDRYGTRVVVLIGGVLLGTGLVSASQVSSLGWFQALFGVLVGLAAGSFYTPLTATTARWFTLHRSLAVALVSAGVSMGTMVMAPLARWLISQYGWRSAMLILGDVVWLVIIVSVAAGIYVARHWPAAALPHARSFAVIGVVLFVVGLLLRWWAIVTLGRFFTVDVTIEKDHELVERGPFRMVRHPSYTGVLLAFGGVALSLGNWAALLVILLSIGAAFAPDRAFSSTFMR